MRAFVFSIVLLVLAGGAHADDRPAINWLNRWQEDWSVLADPALRTDALDPVKYISLDSDPKTYLSLGLTVRERFEATDATPLGVAPDPRDGYLLSRVQVHADLHITRYVQLFAQLASYLAPGKLRVTPIDRDAYDLEQAFVAVHVPIRRDALTFRIGRQEIALDRQRFVGIRDGPNVRQPYDAVWVRYTRDLWRMYGFYSQPVQVHAGGFDDTSSARVTFSGLRAERTKVGRGTLSAYAAQYRNHLAAHLTLYVGDARYAGETGSWDWDVEAMAQAGALDHRDVRAWATGAIVGHTWTPIAWAPRLALQVDTASGTRDPNGTDGTFNALFPNGYYETLPGYPGYANLIHIKPSVTVRPVRSLAAMFAVAALWRETTADAVYLLPSIPIAGTAGEGGLYTGAYAHVHVDWFMTAHWASALELVHFAVGDSLRRASVHDNDYVGLELRYAL